MPPTLDDKLAELRRMAQEPRREPMNRGDRMPTPGNRVLVLEQELVRQREALRQALAIIETLR